MVGNLFGLFMATRPRMGIANPFALYFLVWSMVFVSYYISKDTFNPVSSEFLLVIFSASAVALLILLTAYGKKHREKMYFLNIEINFRGRLLSIIQLFCILSIPFAYRAASSLSGDNDIFSVTGYIYLRTAMTEEGLGLGIVNYFSILSYVICSIRFYKFSLDKKGKLALFSATGTALFYAYINTGRTGALLLTVLVVIPLILRGAISKRGIVISIVALALMFLTVALMTAKGVSVDASFIENLESLATNLRGYTIAPLLAFSTLENSLTEYSFGINSFRFLLSLITSLGISGFDPPALIREYAYVPDPTNVYTVYDVYFRDFSYIGIFLPPTFLVIHWVLYKKALNLSGRWVFYYAASVYPLAMQFFSDQYFSLFSIWLQIAFWYWIFTIEAKRPGSESFAKC